MKKYQSQKNISIGWQEMKLGDVSRIFDGTHQTPEYTKSGIPFYSVEHVTANDFSDTKYISEEVFKKESERIGIEKGDILMTRIGDVGTAKYINWDARASFYVSLALIKCKKIVDPKFLTFFINSSHFQKEIWGKTIHVAFPNKINLGDISKCRVITPSLGEQHRIVSILETWDKTIEKLTKKIKVKKNIKKGLMQNLLTGKIRLAGFEREWSVVTLDKLCNISTGKKDVNEGNFNGKYPFFTCAREYTYSDNYSYDMEAILIAGNADVGHCKYFYGKFEAYQRTYILSKFTNVNAIFLFLFLSYFFKNQVESLKQIGAMSYIKLPMLKEFFIKKPEIKEQKAIANILTMADTEIKALEKKLSVVKEQRKFLLNNLIAGALRTPEKLSINV